MTKYFSNSDFKEFKAAVEYKKAALIICKSDKTSFGLLIVDPIIFDRQWTSSSQISAFNIDDRIEFSGNGEVRAWDFGQSGMVEIDSGEVVIVVKGKGEYYARSNCGRQALNIRNNTVNAITKVKDE